MSKMTLSRRTCLRGLGGITLSLPTLESMLNGNGTAHADGSALARRYVVCFGGYSLGEGYDKLPEMFTPTRTGFDYDLPLAVEPFGGLPHPATQAPIKNEISIVSGLLIPSGAKDETDASKIPPGGKPANHHGFMLSPLLTGMRSVAPYGSPGGPSSDQVVAEANAGATTFPYLTFAIQARDYYSGSSVQGMSVRSNALGVWMAPQDKPSQSWKKLFEGFAPRPEDGEAAARQFAILKKQKKSVLDAVLVPGRVSKLLGRVSTADRAALEQHFQNIRGLEKSLDGASNQFASCQRPTQPGADPPLAAVYKDGESPTTSSQYSNEELRAKLLVDFTQMALVCDLTRVVSLVFTGPQSDLNMYQLVGAQYLRGPIGMHGLTHGFNNGFGDQKELARGIAWHMKHFANLVAKLRDTPEGAGSVIDNAALLFLCEGGFGASPEDPAGEGPGAHSTENMAVVIAGRAGGLKPGQHIRAYQKHPAQVLISGMNAVGVNTTKLGEVTGNIPELFG